ncbi:MAG: hypothetical protein Q7W13_11340 [Bacteroidia bacterium]|nr:hypothetical protein [Bacteroidia bacterium]
METLTKKSEKKGIKSNWSSYSLLFSFILLFAIKTMAQGDENSAELLLETQKNNAHKEFMSYVYMVIGFVAVIGIALFSVLKKKKGGNHTIQGPPAVKHHHHSSYDKRYGSSRHARG